MTKLAGFAPAPAKAELHGVRVVVDARPIQEPERSPLTAWYLDRLLHAYAAEPLSGESFVIVTRALREDPALALAAAGLPIAASRRIPPTTRVLRSAGMTLDSFLLRGAEVGTGVSDPGGAVFHTAGGAVPLASQLPVVATILDLAPWELPETYAATPAARFGHRLRARVLRDAARVIVCSRAVGESARRRLHIPAERMSVVPLAVDQELVAAARDDELMAAARARLGLPQHYIAFTGRYDARKDLRTLLRAMAVLRARTGTSGGRTSGGRSGTARRARAGPPALVLALDGDDEEHRRAARLVESSGVEDLVTVTAMHGSLVDRAAVLRGADAAVQPALSDATAIGALEAIALGIPVICSRSGALPETVGSAGIVVEPRDPDRMAAALEAMWAAGSLAQQLRRQARRRAATAPRTWPDVARETREAYAQAAESAVPRSSSDDDAGESALDRVRSVFDRIALR